MENTIPSTPPSFLMRLKSNKPMLITLAAFIVILYVGFTIGIWMYAKNTKSPVPSSQPVTEERTVPPKENQISQTLPTSTPTPRPTGPGPYACSSIGVCKLYSDTVRKEKCTVTFEDSLCLDQCADSTKQCQK